MSSLSSRVVAALFAGVFLSVAPLPAGVVQFTATINSAQETTGSDSTATGTATMLYDVTANTFDLVVTINNLANPLTLSHIHEGAPGVAGGPVVSFGTAEDNYTRSGNTVTATFTDLPYLGTPATLLAGNAYLNYHTAVWTGGEVRGQLVPQPVKLHAMMTPGQETGTVTSNAFGAAQATYDPATNMITTTVCVYNFTNTLTNSHIHEAPVGVNGGVTLGFGAAAVYANNGTTYIQQFGPSVYPGSPVALLSEGAYVNVHSNVYTPGEIRGQLYVGSAPSVGRLVNVSARARVGTGDDVLISGFFVQGNEPVRVLVTARGPGLTTVTGALADPVLNVYDASNNLIFTNDNVGDAPLQAAITGFTGVSLVTAESGALLILPPGGYTGIVSGAGATTGVGLAEAFEVSW